MRRRIVLVGVLVLLVAGFAAHHVTAQSTPIYTTCQSVGAGASPNPASVNHPVFVAAFGTCPVNATATQPAGQAALFSFAILPPGGTWTPVAGPEPGTRNEGRSILFSFTPTSPGDWFYSVTVSRADTGFSQQVIGFITAQ